MVLVEATARCYINGRLYEEGDRFEFHGKLNEKQPWVVLEQQEKRTQARRKGRKRKSTDDPATEFAATQEADADVPEPESE